MVSANTPLILRPMKCGFKINIFLKEHREMLKILLKMVEYRTQDKCIETNVHRSIIIEIIKVYNFLEFYSITHDNRIILQKHEAFKNLKHTL